MSCLFKCAGLVKPWDAKHEVSFRATSNSLWAQSESSIPCLLIRRGLVGRQTSNNVLSFGQAQFDWDGSTTGRRWTEMTVFPVIRMYSFGNCVLEHIPARRSGGCIYDKLLVFLSHLCSRPLETVLLLASKNVAKVVYQTISHTSNLISLCVIAERFPYESG